MSTNDINNGAALAADTSADDLSTIQTLREAYIDIGLALTAARAEIAVLRSRLRDTERLIADLQQALHKDT